ncbi:MAG: hypothetical protein V8Q84_12995 [Bilophila sp.]
MGGHSRGLRGAGRRHAANHPAPLQPGEAIALKTLVDSLPLSRSATVHHLKALEQAGLLVPLRHGRSLSYTLNAARLVEALDRVKDYAAAYLTATDVKADGQDADRPHPQGGRRPKISRQAKNQSRSRPHSEGRRRKPLNGGSGLPATPFLRETFS